MSKVTSVSSSSVQSHEQVLKSTKYIEWIIENVSFNVQKMGQAFHSMYFGVRYKHEVVEWRLHLYPRGKDNKEDVVFEIEKREFEMDECYYLNLSVLTGNKLLFRNKYEMKFVHETIWSIKQLFRANSLCSDLVNDMLTFRCEISLAENNEMREYFLHIESLVADLLKLSTSKECSDLILYVDDEEFHVHRCILSVRWPNLIKYLGYNSYKDMPPRVTVPGTSPAIMKDLISFVYTGKVDFTYSPEMLKSITRLELSSLLTELNEMPYSYTYRTVVVVNQSTVEWNIGDISSWDESTVPFIRVLPIKGLSSLRQILLLFPIVKSNDEDHLHVVFKIPGSNRQESVLLKCRMTLSSDQSGDRIAFFDDYHLFDSCGEWQFPHSVEKSQVLTKKNKAATRKRSLTIELWISDGTESNCLDTIHTEFHIGSRPVDLRRLREDLMQLYLFRAYDSDLKIRTVDGTDLNVDKAIFQTRWPEYEKSCAIAFKDFEEPNDVPVLLSQFQTEVWNVLLDYIYGACMVDLNPLRAQKLLEVDRVAKLPDKLKEKCIALSNGNINI